MTTHHIVEIEWVDIASNHGWDSFESYLEHDVATCYSVGYLVKKTKSLVTILQSVARDGEVTESLTIPRACVKKIRVLK